MGTTKNLCADCSSHQKTCCQERDIYLTPGDLKRIQEYVRNENFYEFRIPSDPSYLAVTDDPMWKEHVFRLDNTRRVLKQDPVGNCIFLSPNGCIMSINERPLVCRLHPYEYNADGLCERLVPECPVYLLESGITLQDAIGLNPDQALQWHYLLYSEILMEH
ncbi:MAG: YkgJ family cysteine cluster protein [Pseudomonadota bacterium]|uniref:YkgJ family cysteine cluster protein n=1 Tax=Candidatus Desulfatibia profunda TaxID=2841695 RepID=A0A8J6TNM9_9BACT|nr:YkgJ family cysteine cluster protein [Candidatus Desulfatibia profunda]MBL7178641.1 YkgJ family cysteine cluster protein [Desulfobacterales bacterium]MBU0698627.1 YkgJ family cysteine cluster protein [Pseudomonadota bacterium]